MHITSSSSKRALRDFSDKNINVKNTQIFLYSMRAKNLLENIVFSLALATACTSSTQQHQNIQAQTNVIEIRPNIYKSMKNGVELIVVSAQYNATGVANPRKISEIALQSYVEDHISKDTRIKEFKTDYGGSPRDIRYGGSRLMITYKAIIDANGKDITKDVLKTLPSYSQR